MGLVDYKVATSYLLNMFKKDFFSKIEKDLVFKDFFYALNADYYIYSIGGAPRRFVSGLPCKDYDFLLVKKHRKDLDVSFSCVFRKFYNTKLIRNSNIGFSFVNNDLIYDFWESDQGWFKGVGKTCKSVSDRCIINLDSIVVKMNYNDDDLFFNRYNQAVKNREISINIDLEKIDKFAFFKNKLYNISYKRRFKVNVRDRVLKHAKETGYIYSDIMPNSNEPNSNDDFFDFK